MSLYKKIIIISLVFNFLLFSSYFLYKKITDKKYRVENNIVKIIKEAEIIDNNQNPNGIFLDNKNIGENILNGFFISTDTILTANHGTNGDQIKYKIIDIDGNNYEGNLIASYIKNDTALIKINTKLEQYKEIRANNKYEIGNKVFSISYSTGISIKSGEIIDIKDNKIYTNIIFESGESGSPLFNENGRILGINLEVDLEKNMGISSNLNFLDEK